MILSSIQTTPSNNLQPAKIDPAAIDLPPTTSLIIAIWTHLDHDTLKLPS